MSLAKKIRDLIDVHLILGALEVTKAIQAADPAKYPDFTSLRGKVNAAIGDMVRSGALLKSNGYPAKYSPGNPVRTWRYEDPDDRAAARVLARQKADANRSIRRRALAAQTAPQREAAKQQRAMDRAQAALQRLKDKEKRRELSKVQRREYDRKRKLAKRAAQRLAEPKPAKKPATPQPGRPVYREGRKLRLVDVSKATPAKGPRDVSADVAAWLADPKNEIEKLDVGAGKTQLKFSGHRALHQESWNNRVKKGSKAA